MQQGSVFRPFMTAALALGVTFSALVAAGNIPYRLGVLVYPEQLVLVVLGFSLFLGFLSQETKSVFRWLDLALGPVGMAACLWLAWRYGELSANFYRHEAEVIVLGFVLIPLVLEVLRRRTGWSLVIVVLAFIFYGTLADWVPGTLQGRAMPLPNLLGYVAVDSTAMLGVPLSIAVNVIVAYILFGSILMATGGSRWFTDLSTALVGRSRGGSAKIAIVSSALFGSISGSAVANVASTGVITIPLMKRGGFSPRLAASFEAVASTGGQMMPPVMGAAAFLMAEFLQVPYTTIVIAAIVPSALFFLAVIIQADLEARVQHIPPVDEDLIPPLKQVLRDGWYFSIPFAVLVGLMFLFNKSPAEAAIWATAVTVILNAIFGYQGERINVRAFWSAMIQTGQGCVEIIVIGAVAGIVIGILQVTGLGFGLTYLLVSFGQGNLFLLLLVTAAICIILGMGMPTTGIYLLVATLAAPPLLELGVPPLAAHFFIFYFGMLSMISPPVAVAAFAAASIAGASAMKTAMTSVRVGWPAFIVPFLFVYSPTLLMQGNPLEIVIAFVTAILGVWFVTIAIVGFYADRLSVAKRLWALVAGAMVLIPSGAFEHAMWLEMAGGAMIAVWLWQARRSGAPAPVVSLTER